MTGAVVAVGATIAMFAMSTPAFAYDLNVWTSSQSGAAHITKHGDVVKLCDAEKDDDRYCQSGNWKNNR